MPLYLLTKPLDLEPRSRSVNTKYCKPQKYTFDLHRNQKYYAEVAAIIY
jgi:hypothetical protein